MIALSGVLPGVAYDSKVAAQQAEMRQMRWRAAPELAARARR